MTRFLLWAGVLAVVLACQRATTTGFQPSQVSVLPKHGLQASLSSSYPEGTPAGLRGEAVRSALVTTERCLGWNLSGGVLEIQGQGTLAFLNGKLTHDFATKGFREACLLDAKGRLVDVVKVVTTSEDRALVLTSPGHSSTDLWKRLDPYVFPMDGVVLTNHGTDASFGFVLASTQYSHIQKVLEDQTPLSGRILPGTSKGVVWKHSQDVEILVVPSVGLPSVACVGYTFVFFGKEAADFGREIWEHLIGEENLEGPIAVGDLEYETLRIEAGQPAFGHEFGIDKTHSKKIPNGPLDLHFHSLIDFDKGCYLGQEGVASVLKNPRGPIRSLYSVVFDDDVNEYETNDDDDNLTRLPRSGQSLYALGSNEKILVGTLSSMGEAGGTGSSHTVGLALIKRADSIRKKLKAMDISVERDLNLDVDPQSGSGILQPPPMDPLDGLEVIVEGTFTVGVLRSIPSRRSSHNMFDPDIPVERVVVVEVEDEPNYREEESLEAIEAEMAQATIEAEAAAAEAKRKAEKMKALQKRAEEAMKRRRQASSKQEDLAEVKRKADKMALLKQQAEEAKARRRKQQND